MRRCWNDEPTARPTFDELVEWIDSVIRKARPGSRTDASRLYLNIARPSAPSPPSHRGQPAADVAPGTAGLPNDDDEDVEDEVRYR